MKKFKKEFIPYYILVGILASLCLFRLSLLSIPTAILASVLILIALLLFNPIEKYWHKRVLKFRSIKELCKQVGFEPENRKQYQGLKGVYKGYFIRLYYEQIGREGGLFLLIYFTPPRRSDGRLNLAVHNSLQEKHRLKYWFDLQSDLRSFRTSHVRLRLMGLDIYRSRKILKHLNDAIQLIKEYGLSPASENQVESFLKQDSFYHGPSINHFPHEDYP